VRIVFKILVESKILKHERLKPSKFITNNNLRNEYLNNMKRNQPSPTCREDLTIAIAIALPREYDPVALAFDQFWNEEHRGYGKVESDHNPYTTDRIGGHDVV
jgi:hypothetical protein